MRSERLPASLLVAVLALSAACELVGWGAAGALGQGADAFPGTRGDPHRA